MTSFVENYEHFSHNFSDFDNICYGCGKSFWDCEFATKPCPTPDAVGQMRIEREERKQAINFQMQKQGIMERPDMPLATDPDNLVPESTKAMAEKYERDTGIPSLPEEVLNFYSAYAQTPMGDFYAVHDRGAEVDGMPYVVALFTKNEDMEAYVKWRNQPNAV